MSFDELPVGQRTHIEIPEHLEPSAAPPKSQSLPLSERMASKNFKVRLEALSELFELFNSAEVSASTFLEHYTRFPKLLADTNARIQEKAVDCLLLLIAQAPPSTDQTLGDVVRVLVEKCLPSKGAVKEKAVRALIELSEVEANQAIIKDTIKEMLSVKTAPKISAGAICILTQLLVNYGSRCYPVKAFAGSVAGLGESTNSQVRAEVLNYLKEAYKWAKADIEKLAANLRQAQQEELRKYFGEVTEAPKALRLLGDPAAEDSAVQKDSYLAAAEVAVLKRFGDHWCSQVVRAKKWTEKRDKLDELLKAIAVERIKPEPFPELGKTIKLLLQDPNAVVVNSALKVIGQLAKALRGNFSSYSRGIFEFVVQKWKDKKAAAEAQKCMESLAHSLKLEDTLEQVREKLDDKSPIIRARMCAWLASIIPEATPALVRAIGAALGLALVKLTEDAASEVREEALNCIGVLKEFVGENSEFGCLISELNTLKQSRIKKANIEKNKPVKRETVQEKKEEKKQPRALNEEQVSAAEKLARKKHSNGDKAPIKPSIEEKNNSIQVKENLSDAMKAKGDAANQISAKIISGLSDPSVKQRQEAKEAIERILSANNKILPSDLSPLMLALRGRMEEPNKALARGFIALVGVLAQSLGQDFREHSRAIVQPLVLNLSDKHIAIKSETLSTIGKITEAVGAECVIDEMGMVLERESAEIRAVLLRLVLKNKEALGRCDKLGLVSHVAAALQDKSKEVRNLAEQVVKEIIAATGADSFASMVQELRPGIRSALQTLLGKRKGSAAKQEANEDKSESPSTAETSLNRKNSKKRLTLKSTSTLHIKSTSDLVPLAALKTQALLSETTSPGNTSIKANKPKESKSKLFSSKKSKKPSDPLNEAPVKLVTCSLGNKEKRAEADRVHRWTSGKVREDYLERLKKTLKGVLDGNLFNLMFSTQFKGNVEALNMLAEGVKSELDGIVDLLDLVFKWILTRLVDQNNTQMLKGVMSFLLLLFKELENKKYKMLEFEAVVIMPVLAERIGAANPGIKQQVKEILKISCELYSPEKVAAYIINSLESSNNIKAKLDCLALLKELTDKYSADKLLTQKDIRSLVKVAGSPDSLLKLRALELLNEVYRVYGEAIWSLLCDLPKDTIRLLRRKFVSSVEGEIIGSSIETSKSQESLEAGASTNSKINIDKCESLKKESCESVDEGVEDRREKSLVLAEELKETGEMRGNTRNKAAILRSAEVLSTTLNNLQQTLLKSKGIKEEDNAKTIRRENSTKQMPLESSLMLGSNTLADVEVPFSLRTPNPKFKPSGGAFTSAADSSYSTMKYEISEKSYKDISLQSIATEGKNKQYDIGGIQNQAPNFSNKEVFGASYSREQDFNEIIECLKSTDIRKKASSLICINKKLASSVKSLAEYCDQLYEAFTEVLDASFAKSVQEIPVRFLKYFATVIVRVCSNKLITERISERVYSYFIDQLLKNLVCEELEVMEESNGGRYLAKALNAALVRILENANLNTSFAVFFGLLKIYQTDIDKKNSKIVLITVKSILKLARSMDSSVDGSKVLLVIHSYLVSFAEPGDMVLRMSKTAVSELVKIRGNSVWTDYKLIQSLNSDTHIKTWISILLEPISVQELNGSGVVRIESADDLKGIFRGMGSQATFQDAVKKLKAYTMRHPETSVEKYFAACSKGFKEYVMNSLRKCEVQGDPSLLSAPCSEEAGVASARPISSAAEYKSKLAMLKQKFDIGKR